MHRVGTASPGQYDYVDERRTLRKPRLALRLPPVLIRHDETLDIKSYSVFVQSRYKILPNLELAAGARWTDEEREITPFNLVSGQPVFVSLAVPKLDSGS